ncbi:MAG: YraN family protein [Candidatus Omnitrophica bacterium]|nr:YraN family protein [Candidatus Omnitrophota bacterium]
MKTSNGVKTKNLETGYMGEAIAKKYLEDNGYRVVELNYRTKYAEIDLIAYDKDVLVFIEVRTKIGEQFGTPEETINKNKISRLIRNAEAYIAIKNCQKECRIDAFCVVLDKNRKVERLNHYKNITL